MCPEAWKPIKGKGMLLTTSLQLFAYLSLIEILPCLSFYFRKWSFSLFWQMLKHLCHYWLNKAIFDVHLKQGLWRNVDIVKEMRSIKDWGGQKVSPCFIPFFKTNEEWRPTWCLTLGIGMATALNNSCSVPTIGKQTKVINSCWLADKAALSIGCAISILLCHLFLE